MAGLRMPVLFIVGSEDPLFKPAIIRSVHELVPGAEYVELEGSGHSGDLEDAQLFDGVVGRFLDRHVLRTPE